MNELCWGREGFATCAVVISVGEEVCVHQQKVVYPLLHWLMEDYIVVAQSARQALQAVASSSRLR